jgi:hypothetical protein
MDSMAEGDLSLFDDKSSSCNLLKEENQDGVESNPTLAALNFFNEFTLTKSKVLEMVPGIRLTPSDRTLMCLLPALFVPIQDLTREMFPILALNV